MGSGCLSVIFTLALVFGVAVTSTDASAVGKARPRPRNEPGYHMPPVDEEKTQADSLNSHWDYLIDKLSSNSDTPSQLVIDLVSLSLTQLDIYGFVKEKSTRTAMLKMKIANNTYVVLELVIDNFKKGLRALMSEMSKGELGELDRTIRDIDPEDILQLRKLYHSTCYGYDTLQIGKTFRSISCFVDIRRMLVERFLAAYPLVKRMAAVIENVHRGFMNNEPNAADRAWTTSD